MNILQFFISIFFIYLVYNIANQKKIYDVCFGLRGVHFRDFGATE